MLRQKKLDKQYISQVKISGIDDINGFKCSSGEVTNQFLDDIGRRIKREEGLESLEIEDYYD